MQGCYLIHFERPICEGHPCQHYIGVAKDIDERVSKHHQGNFIQAVKERDPDVAVSNLKDAIRSDIISHLCDIAVRTGEKVTWDPIQQELIGGSQQARQMLSRPMRKPWTL